MRRLARWIFNAATVLSLVLCLATLCDMIGYHGRYDHIGFTRWKVNGATREFTGWELCTHNGIEYLLWGPWADEAKKSLPSIRHLDYGSQPWRGPWTALRFGTVHEDIVRSVNFSGLWARHRGVYAPIWVVWVSFAILPAAWLIRWRRKRRLSLAGHRCHCGYNLTGNISGICPECGTAIAAKS